MTQCDKEENKKDQKDKGNDLDSRDTTKNRDGGTYLLSHLFNNNKEIFNIDLAVWIVIPHYLTMLNADGGQNLVSTKQSVNEAKISIFLIG